MWRSASFCAKDEKNSLLATLWFNIAHYALRPWAWILTALAVVVLYPQLSLPGADAEGGFVRVWVDYLPHAFRGLMLAAFAAAYMSTVATELNWGSSYLVNDFYRRFVARHRSDRHYVTVFQNLDHGADGGEPRPSPTSCTRWRAGWDMVVNIGAGTGAVYLLRWYWWRINAWSEISSMATAAVVSITLKFASPFAASDPNQFAKNLVLTVIITTVVWVATTLLTQPEPESKLLEFYRRVRPGVKAGWRRIAALAPEILPRRMAGIILMDWGHGLFDGLHDAVRHRQTVVGLHRHRPPVPGHRRQSPDMSSTGICRAAGGRRFRGRSEEGVRCQVPGAGKHRGWKLGTRF
jgi:SSS family solute:Na+ symporter